MNTLNIKKDSDSKIESLPKEKNTLQVVASKALLGFFVLMILLTILSRVADSLTIPRVETCNVKGSNLTYNITGDGTLVSNENNYIDLQESIRVNSVEVSVGDFVKKGDTLLTYCTEDISELLTQAKKDLRKVEIQIEQEELGIDDSVLNIDERHLSKEKKSIMINNKLIKLRIESLKIDLDDIKEYLNELKILQKNDGVLDADYAGRIEFVGIEKGKKVASDEDIVMGISGLAMNSTVQEVSGKYLEVGDELQVSRLGKNDRISAKIIKLVNREDDIKGDVIDIVAKLPDDFQYNTGILSFTIHKVSSMYQNCVPITALREDTLGTFLLVLKSVNTTLGEELKAERINVNILKKDSTYAVLAEGQISNTDQIIVSSNKIINQGDRVRLAD